VPRLRQGWWDEGLIFEEEGASAKIDMGDLSAPMAPALSGENALEPSGAGAAPAGNAERPPHPVSQSAKQAVRAKIEPGDLIAVGNSAGS
jgi:hypothetical protein